MSPPRKKTSIIPTFTCLLIIFIATICAPHYYSRDELEDENNIISNLYHIGILSSSVFFTIIMIMTLDFFF